MAAVQNLPKQKGGVSMINKTLYGRVIHAVRDEKVVSTPSTSVETVPKAASSCLHGLGCCSQVSIAQHKGTIRDGGTSPTGCVHSHPWPSISVRSGISAAHRVAGSSSWHYLGIHVSGVRILSAIRDVLPHRARNRILEFPVPT